MKNLMGYLTGAKVYWCCVANNVGTQDTNNFSLFSKKIWKRRSTVFLFTCFSSPFSPPTCCRCCLHPSQRFLMFKWICCLAQW